MAFYYNEIQFATSGGLIGAKETHNIDNHVFIISI